MTPAVQPIPDTPDRLRVSSDGQLFMADGSNVRDYLAGHFKRFGGNGVDPVPVCLINRDILRDMTLMHYTRGA